MRPPIEILLVEDNPGDVRLVNEALRESRAAHHVSVARNGDEAMTLLLRHGPFAEAPRPDLVLLDLNLTGKDGRQVLAEVKSSPNLKAIPVIVPTTSADHQDVRRSYQLQANAYVVKPVDFDQFLVTMCSIVDFWLARVTFPPRSSRLTAIWLRPTG
jgi:CheY-like chemotaxis protein